MKKKLDMTDPQTIAGIIKGAVSRAPNHPESLNIGMHQLRNDYHVEDETEETEEGEVCPNCHEVHSTDVNADDIDEGPMPFSAFMMVLKVDVDVWQAMFKKLWQHMKTLSIKMVIGELIFVRELTGGGDRDLTANDGIILSVLVRTEDCADEHEAWEKALTLMV